MANNIYIGNRYVPKFADPVEWDNLREYEPLTIVTYQGTSYTSKKLVPIGTALSNTEYWAVTGNYNAQVEIYRQEVAAVQEDLDVIQEDIEDINTNITGIRSDVTSLTGRVSENESDIADIETRLNSLDNKRVVIIGDSYSIGTTSGGTVTGWSTRFKNISGLASEDCYIFDEGGSGFIGNITNKFIDLLNNNYSQVTSRDTITDVLFVGGYNDAGKDRDTLIANIGAAIARAKQLFTNATVWLGMVGFSIRPEGTARQNMIACAHDYITASAANDAKYLTNSELFLLSDPKNLMSDDDIHPTSTGYYIMGNLIWQAVSTGGTIAVPAAPLYTLDFTPASGITFSSPKYCYINGRTKELYISGSNPSIDFAEATDITANTNIEIGSFTDKSFCGIDEEVLSSQIARVAVQVNNKFLGYNVSVFIKNRKLYFKFKDVPEGSGEGVSSWQGFTGVTNIYLVTRRFTFDARLV